MVTVPAEAIAAALVCAACFTGAIICFLQVFEKDDE